MYPVRFSVQYLYVRTLVCPIPGVSTLWEKVFLCRVPVVLGVSFAITRDVNVFA